METQPLFLFIDPYLIWFYRISDSAPLGFVIGTMVLALHAVMIGEISLFLAFLGVRGIMAESNNEATRFQDLSEDALKAGDKPAYTRINKLANEAYGKSFFHQLALSGARLWPAFFALAWMQVRFADIELPLPFGSLSLGYIGLFLLTYLAVLSVFKRVKGSLPLFRWMKVIMEGQPARRREVNSFTHLAAVDPNLEK